MGIPEDCCFLWGVVVGLRQFVDGLVRGEAWWRVLSAEGYQAVVLLHVWIEGGRIRR